MVRRKKNSPQGLTPRQLDVLRFVRQYQQRHGYSPTMQELADQFAVSKVTIFEHLGALERKGWLSRARYRARSLKIDPEVALPEPSPDAGGLSLAGYIAAGRPIEAIQDNQRLDIDSMFLGRHNTFALQVRGDSMIDEHIADGDYVIVEQRSLPRDGQTVVALLDNGEATLKKFYREPAQAGQPSRIRLQPANPSYAPIYADADKLKIQGVVVGVIRKFRD